MILVLGNTGFLGKRVCKILEEKSLKYQGISLSKDLDLRDRSKTLSFFLDLKPRYVLNCAAYVGGIQFGYKHPAELFHNNLHMTLNILEASSKSNVKRLINPISNCAYPSKLTFFKEEDFWEGPLHESVLIYGLARKISWAGSWAYSKQYNLDVINIILSNMYGPEDHFEEEKSHALGALVMKIFKAKKDNLPYVNIWGSGKPVREWLYIDDGANAMINAMHISSTTDPINIGVGKGISIIELATIIAKELDYKGEFKLDLSKPDGASFKTMDGTKGKEYFNWEPEMDLKKGIKETVKWYTNNQEKL